MKIVIIWIVFLSGIFSIFQIFAPLSVVLRKKSRRRSNVVAIRGQGIAGLLFSSLYLGRAYGHIVGTAMTYRITFTILAFIYGVCLLIVLKSDESKTR